MASSDVTVRAEPETGYAPATPGTPAGPVARRACRNCGAALPGPFCAGCGQRDLPADPSLRELAEDLVDNVLNVDGRVAATFRALVTRPGELTVAYLGGRRAPFLTPLRVYLTCSVLYFAVAALTPDPIRVVSGASRDLGGGAQVPITGVDPEDSAEIQRAVDGLRRSPNAITRYMGEIAYRAQTNPTLVKRRSDEVLPKIMFVLVPAFAALTAALFRRRFRYPAHLVFALHVHAFTFLALIAIEAAKAALSLAAILVVSAVVWAAVAAYLVAAVRRVFSTSLRTAIVRTAALGAVYFVALSLVRLVGLVIALTML